MAFAVSGSYASSLPSDFEMSNPPKKLLGQPHPPSSTRILEMNPFSTSLQLSRDTNHLIFVVGVVGSHVKHIVYNTVLPPIKNSFDLRNTCFEVQIQVTFLQALQCNAIAKPQSEISAESRVVPSDCEFHEQLAPENGPSPKRNVFQASVFGVQKC